MKGTLTKLIKNGFRGKNTHAHPNQILQGLTAEMARQTPTSSGYSSWEILHHIVEWQKFCIEVAKGNTVPWKTVKAEEWPSSDALKKDSTWDKLVSTFKQGLREASKITDTVDLLRSMPGWNNAPAMQALLVLAQHNSYHLGQIVAIRKALGYWPPPKIEE